MSARTSAIVVELNSNWDRQVFPVRATNRAILPILWRDPGTGLGPVAWPSDAELEDRLGVGRSQCKKIIQAALEGGYVRLRRSANGKRFGVRDRTGRIAHAYGFDLSPLVERTDEFTSKTAEWEARRVEGKQLRREIGILHGAARSMIELAMAESAAGHDWAAFAAKADSLIQQRGRDRDPLSLLPIVARLRALRVWVREAVASATAFLVNHDSSGPMGPEYRPHTTTTKHLLIVGTTTGSAKTHGPEERSRDRQPSPEVTANKDWRLRNRDALRGFVATPAFVLAIAPTFGASAGSSGMGWPDLATAALQVCHELGVSKYAWGQACVTLGRQAAVLALASIAARHARGLVQSPGGLLRRMVELHEAGTLRLDRTLFGLADRLNHQGHSASPTKPSSAAQ